MDLRTKQIFRTLNPNKVWIPIALGIGIVFYLFYSDPDVTRDSLAKIFDAAWLPVVLALVVIFFRDAGYAFRIRALTTRELSWNSSIYVIILWEFASAVTPSVVGGTAVAVFILLKEGLPLGKALAFVMVTAILDNLFFLVAAPVAFLFTNGEAFPESVDTQLKMGNSLQYLFYLSYGLIALYTAIMSFGLFARPRAIKWLLIRITHIRFLKRWRYDAIKQGDEIIMASRELKGKETTYWVRLATVTFFIWCARYLMLNAMVEAYVDLSFADHIIVFARNVIMWIVMLISPTPGSSGTAEFFFQEFYQPYLGEYTFGTSIFWRLLSYYPYLILGAIFLPRWLRKVFFKKETT